MSYKRKPYKRTSISNPSTLVAETIEETMVRVIEGNETIDGEKELIYSERKHGVLAGYNMRTDKFEIAVEATTVIAKSEIAERKARIDQREAKMEIVKDDKGDARGESTQGTS